MNSAPSAYPPEDLGEPKKYEAHLSYNMVRTASKNPLTFLGIQILNGGLIVLGVGLIIWGGYLWWGIAAMLGSMITGRLITRLHFGAKDPASRERNVELYDHIYEKTESNRLTNLLMWNASIEKVDLYNESTEHAIKEVLQAGKKTLRIGQTQCSQGHSGLCKHRLPTHLTQWIEEA